MISPEMPLQLGVLWGLEWGLEGGANEEPLTALAIEHAKPRAKRYALPNIGHPGLRVLVYPSGVRTFVYRFRRGEKEDAQDVTVVLGPSNGPGALTLVQAREAAGDARRQRALVGSRRRYIIGIVTTRESGGILRATTKPFNFAEQVVVLKVVDRILDALLRCIHCVVGCRGPLRLVSACLCLNST